MLMNSMLNDTMQEMEFFESMLLRMKDAASQSILNKRAQIAKADPSEELFDLHLEIQELER